MILAFAATGVQAQQKMALNCTTADVAKVEASTKKITNPTQKTAADRELAMAKEMMAKKDDKACVAHLSNAAAMAPM
ncbi:MAG TPA: hypothetical protein VJ890_00690 [Vineibacter sp.]|nr:hypothetical protein [Vineibacter sp.]